MKQRQLLQEKNRLVQTLKAQVDTGKIEKEYCQDEIRTLEEKIKTLGKFNWNNYALKKF